MTERMKWSPRRKENAASFDNILENRWTRWRVFATYTCSRGKTNVTHRSQTKTLSAPQTPRIQVNQEEANLITFTPIVEQPVPPVQGATGIQEQPKRQRSPRKKKNSEWTLNQRQFEHSKTQEISHILPSEQLNVFNGEESMSYLQLPVKKKEENRFCTRCGEMGHGRRYCQVNTWCKICERQSYSVKQKKHTGTGTRAESSCKSTRTTSTTIVSTSACATL